MKHSKKYKDWKSDLNLVSQLYDIDPSLANQKKTNVFAQLMQAATAISTNLDSRLEEEAGTSLAEFIRTSGDSLFELYNLLKLILNLNMISIDEYHSLTSSLNEIGEIIENFLIQNNLVKEDSGNSNALSTTADIAYWTLN